jgi:hypothetical protein
MFSFMLCFQNLGRVFDEGKEFERGAKTGGRRESSEGLERERERFIPG